MLLWLATSLPFFFLPHISLGHFMPNFEKFLLLQSLALSELSNLRITLIENLP